MTPKEKARELFDKYQIAGSQWYVDTTKKYALIAVDEIEQALTDYGRGDSLQLQNMDSEFRFWEQVKTEIEKL
jgi:hypothetical protein